MGGVRNKAHDRPIILAAVMSFVQVMSHSGGGLAADRTPFYGIKLPSEVKSLIQLYKKVDHATMRKVLKSKCT